MRNNQTRTGNWFVDQLNFYQSANSDKESIKRNFVIRKEEFELVIADLLNKKEDDPLQHELFLGRRGSGKSTLLRRIQIEIEENEELNKRYIAINLAEEQAGIYRLFDLWTEVFKELSIRSNLSPDIEDYSSFKNDHEYTKFLYTQIHEILASEKKKVVLLLDNLDRIVENFDDDGNLLRETLLNFNDIQIIGGSTRMDEHFWKYDQPFYEFFRRHRLGSLSLEEIHLLLNYWSKLMKLPQLAEFTIANKGKIEALRIFTDGLPRTLQFFIQILLHDSTLYGFDYIKKVMDNVSPLYQERLNNLPAPQRKIVLEMAFLWEASSTKQLAGKSRMESKLISAQLKQLTNNGVVETITTKKKNHLYRLSERFFNMWLMVTQGNPEQKRKAKWLTIFLETWYDASQLKNLALQHIKNLQANSISYERAVILTKALSQSKYTHTDVRDKMLDFTFELSTSKNKSDFFELPRRYSEIEQEIFKEIKNNRIQRAHEIVEEIENEDDGLKFRLKGLLYAIEEKFSDAENYIQMATKKGDTDALSRLGDVCKNQNKMQHAEKYYLQALEKGQCKALSSLGLLYAKQGKTEEAEKYYLQAIEKGQNGALNNLAILYAKEGKPEDAEKYFLMAIEKWQDAALSNLAVHYDDQGKTEEAEKYYLQAIEKGQDSALNNLAIFYDEQSRTDEAEKYYLQAIEKGQDSALNNLAIFYDEQSRTEEAEKYYLQAIEKGQDEALVNLANHYGKQGKAEEAEKYYLQAIDKGQDEALFNLANHYGELGKAEEAEKYYLQAIEKGQDEALFNLGNHYGELGKAEEAEKYYLQAIEKGQNSALNNLAIFYDEQRRTDEAEKYYMQAIGKGQGEALVNLAIHYGKQGKAEEAEKYYLQAIEKGQDEALVNLAAHYGKQDKAEEAEKYYLQAIEKGQDEALCNLAILYKQQDKTEEAEKYYLQAIEKGQDEALCNLAILYKQQGKTEDAEKHYLQAIEKGQDEALYNLAILYNQQGKTEEAEKYYLLADAKGIDDAMFNLAFLYYSNNQNKIKSLELIKIFHSKYPDQDSIGLKTIVELWNGNFQEFDEQVNYIIDNERNENLSWFIENLLIQHQTHLVLKLFTESKYSKELQDKYSLLYYATILLSSKEVENLELRIAPEVMPTVMEIVEKVKTSRKNYSK